MAVKSKKSEVLLVLSSAGKAVSLPEVLVLLNNRVAERTLRRWLALWVDEGVVWREGNKRSTKYSLRNVPPPAPSFGFLEGLSDSKKSSLMLQLRDLWTHSSTAIEGNTLTLGDTHFVLEEGLTISGKPLKDHQQVSGHATAINLLYSCLNAPLTQELVFNLHKAVQTELVTDIYKPNGAWKLEVNGTYIVTRGGEQVFIEYALPKEVSALMAELVAEINTLSGVTILNAANVYAKIHAGVAHIHPFWDGNGRMARLLANIPLLKSGCPPIVIPVEQRRAYIQHLAEYELSTGQLDSGTGVWPYLEKLEPFSDFCADCYALTQTLVNNMKGH